MQSTVLILAFSVMAPAAKEAPKKEMPSIVGEWKLEEVVRNGESIGAPPQEMTFEFKSDGTCTSSRGEKTTKPSKYKSDISKSPHEIDLELKEIALTIKGVFSIEGETLTVAFIDDPAGERPKKIESPEKSKVLLFKMKRVPPAKK